ncbi:hypothetical protein chiPu_0028327 [Chiloscyllium punctatum]|uniref:Uncharacterized protein n=1 Tax=Chiloscyllium punctatum TaxID=137246 RepID=A0A401TMT3_CHIPU|nr:hypothetical protein [Chiloscyllium punctatum]
MCLVYKSTPVLHDDGSTFVSRGACRAPFRVLPSASPRALLPPGFIFGIPVEWHDVTGSLPFPRCPVSRSRRSTAAETGERLRNRGS